MVIVTSIIVLAGAVLFAFFTTGFPPSVQAHGAGVELNRREFAGPYEVALGIVPDPPALGEIAITLAVIEKQARAVVMDANVTLVGAGPNTAQLGPLIVETDPVDPTFYDLRTSLNHAGAWIFTVNIDAPAGQGSADFTIAVGENNSLTGLITLITLLAFLIILGLAGRAILQGTGKGRRHRH